MLKSAEKATTLEGLTGIRFFAAIGVVLFHVGYAAIATWSQALASATSYGFVAVGLFYTLSGFVLAYTYADRRPDARAFYVARFARIYPLYLVALVLAFPVFWQRTYEHSLVRLLAPLLTVPTMLQAWAPPMALSWNAPAWSLSVEAFFYLLFPAILARLVRRPSRECLWIAAIMWPVGLLPSLVYCWLNPDGLASLTGPHSEAWLRAENSGWLGVVNFNPLCRLPEFIAGVAMGCAFRMGYKRLPRIALALPVCLLLVANRLPYPVIHNALLLPLWCALIFALASPSPMSQRLWTAPWMMILGEASYGIYILQQPVSSWIKLFILRVGGHRIQGDYTSMPLLVGYCFILVVVSVLSFYFIEIPFRAWIRKGLGRAPAMDGQKAVAPRQTTAAGASARLLSLAEIPQPGRPLARS